LKHKVKASTPCFQVPQFKRVTKHTTINKCYTPTHYRPHVSYSAIHNIKADPIKESKETNTKMNWKELHDSLMINKSRSLFESDLRNEIQEEKTRCPIQQELELQLDHRNMINLPLLDGKNVLSVFDTGSTVNLISDQIVKSSPYLSSLPIMECPNFKIMNTSSPINCNKFIEICFKIKHDYILSTTALIVPDFGPTQFILSTKSMSQLQTVMDITSNRVKLKHTSFNFRTIKHIKIPAHKSIIINIRALLPKTLRTGTFFGKSFRPFKHLMPDSFILSFTKGYSNIRLSNTTSKMIFVKGGTSIGSIMFDLMQTLVTPDQIQTHFHQDFDGSISFCTNDPDNCEITTSQEIKSNSFTHNTPVNMHGNNYSTAFEYRPQKSRNSILAEQYEGIMTDYYEYDQENMSVSEISKLKLKTFPYLDPTDIRLEMTDKSIINKELNLTENSVLKPEDIPKIQDFFYQLGDCLSLHDNSSVQTKTFVSLNPVNLKPFYIKPYLTHEREIKFAEKEMEKLRLMGILRRGSSEFLSPIMLIKKAHSGQTLSRSPEFRLVVDFKYLNSHLPDIKFSYPEVKHVLHKVGRSKANIFSVLDLKNAFFTINLKDDSIKYTSCCASPGSPVYQFRKLAQGLKPSPAHFTALMNDILSEMPADTKDYLECIMDDCLIFTPNIALHKYVLKCFMEKLKEYGMLLSVNKIHAFRHTVTYMGLQLSSAQGSPTITPKGSRVDAILTLPIPHTVRGIKSFIGMVTYLSTFAQNLSQLVKPINDILKSVNKLVKPDKIKPLPGYAKGKGKGRQKSPDIRQFWTNEHTISFEKIKQVLSKKPVLCLPNRTGQFHLECDSSAKHVGAILYQEQNSKRQPVAYYSSVMPPAAQGYSSSELELKGLSLAVNHFKYLLKYNHFHVIMDHSALKRIYCSKKEPKTVRIKRFLEEITDYSFDICHQAGTKMFVSDFLSRFSTSDIKPEPIPYLTDISDLTPSAFMHYIDKHCLIHTENPVCENNSFPVITRSSSRQQGIKMPPLFNIDTVKTVKSRKASKAQPKAVTVAPSTGSQSANVPVPKRTRGRPRKNPEVAPAATPIVQDRDYEPIMIEDEQIAHDDIPVITNPRLRMRMPQKTRNVPQPIQKVIPKRARAAKRRRVAPSDEFLNPDKVYKCRNKPDEIPYKPPNTAIEAINKERMTLDTALHKAQENASTIPMVNETLSPVDMAKDFPPLKSLISDRSESLLLKTRKDVPSQRTINRMLDLLNHKSQHVYTLPFDLKTLRTNQRGDQFYMDIIKYLESNHLPSNAKRQTSIISESENFILFHDILFRVMNKSIKLPVYKIALCIPVSIAFKLFEVYHSDLLSSHQGLTRTYYKIRHDFYIRDLYKQLYLYIMSCRICSARREVPINEKQRDWTCNIIEDLTVMRSISMDIKVLPLSERGYRYLLVLRCNHTRYIMVDCLKTRTAREVAESLFQTLICTHGTNVEEIYTDLDTAFNNELMDIIFKTLGIKIKFCSVASHMSNPAERSIQSISNLLIHYISKYSNNWCLFAKLSAFCVNTFPISHLQNTSPYEILHGRSPPALSKLTTQANKLLYPPTFHSADYIQLLNNRLQHIRDMVTEQNNLTIEKRKLQHGSKSKLLREFDIGDIVYVHFPSKSIIAQQKLSSRKLVLNYIGPLYIYSANDKYMYILATIEGRVIEQLFHVSRLKKGLLRLPNNTVVRNIMNHPTKKLPIQKDNMAKPEVPLTQTGTSTESVPTIPTELDQKETGITKSKEVLSHYFDENSHANYIISITGMGSAMPNSWYMDANILLNTSLDSLGNQVANGLQTNAPQPLGRYTFFPETNVVVPTECTLQKARFKAGVLQIYTHIKTATDGVWDTIPQGMEKDMLKSIKSNRIQITGSKRKFCMFLRDVQRLI
jgi:hypothetical protein